MLEGRCSITYSTVDQDSVQDGDYAETGWHWTPEEGFSLRDCLQELHLLHAGEVPIEPSCSPLCSTPGHECWFTATGAINGHLDEQFTQTQYSLHLDGITPSSRKRIGRLLGAYGV